ncbi:MAG: N-acetylmuramoyl-L-alanine amidase [Pseudomonadota bacterium]|nr:N-acetylmuramoyl-L-alanine amidase [Pseudomonadota bacterium]
MSILSQWRIGSRVLGVSCSAALLVACQHAPLASITQPLQLRGDAAELSHPAVVDEGSVLRIPPLEANPALQPSTFNPNIWIDQRIQSPNQDARAMMLVLHYTAETLEETLRVLTDPNRPASAHYVIPDQPEGQFYRVFQIVPEHQRAWHAGRSAWQGHQLLNTASIGIEVVNLAFPASEAKLPMMQRTWIAYPAAQVDVLGQLLRDISQRYQIAPTRIVGHSDIAPSRKLDPGPLFPWQQLYQMYGVGAWYDDDTVDYYLRMQPWSGDVQVLQQKLARYGYDVPQHGQLDGATQQVIAAFQMHFYPTRYDGVPDLPTVARLDALLEKYHGQVRANTP